MKTLILLLSLIFVFLLIYKLEWECFIRKDVVVWGENGVKVVTPVNVYDCGG